MASLIRTLSFFSKWLAELVREPTLLLSLVLGPFLILLLFGVGTRIGGAPPPRTLIVTQPGVDNSGPLGIGAADLDRYLAIVGTTADRDAALAALQRGQVDLVAELPAAPAATVASGQPAAIVVHTSEIDPLKDSYARTYLASQLGVVNQQAIQTAIEAAQAPVARLPAQVAVARQQLAVVAAARTEASTVRQELAALRQALDPLLAETLAAAELAERLGRALGPATDQPVAVLQALADQVRAVRDRLATLEARLAQASSTLPTAAELAEIEAQLSQLERLASQFTVLPPAVLSAPFTLSLVNRAPSAPSTIAFYAPAVLVLLLQHLAVTLGALSLARVRWLGLMEFLQALPVRPAEVLVGHYLAYGTLCLLAAAALLLLLVGALGVPAIGSPLAIIALVVLLLACALGLGFLISLVARSEQQAAQLAMLVLIASVFFSGFMIYLEAIEWPYRLVAFLLPATYAIRGLREVMLRGVAASAIDLGTLGLVALGLLGLTVLLLGREFRPR